MAVNQDTVRAWRKSAIAHAELATDLVQALPDDASEHDRLKVTMTASLATMYYAAAMDADHFGDAPGDG